MSAKRSEERRRRAAAFGGVAEDYERARPGYPIEAIQWMLPTSGRVLDLGAGTGKLTRQLVSAGYEAVAVEPSQEMLNELRRVVLQAEVYLGHAEAIPLPAASVDAVVAAQSFHWFDAPVALAEIARVLRPGGRIALVWNMPDQTTRWLSKLSPLVGTLPDVPPRDIEASIGELGSFDTVEAATFHYEQVLGRDELLKLVSSWSYLALLPLDERKAHLDAVSGLFDRCADDGRIVFPYVTHAYRAHRT